MASADKLSALQERILLSLWKLKGIGNSWIREDIIKADLSSEGSPTEDWVGEVASLRSLGFLETGLIEDQNAMSLTPLGLSILRQIEEDKLQELK
jgi:hypothetical protein